MYTSIDKLKINYEILGKGEPILLLHGWGGSLESLKALGSRLVAHGQESLDSSQELGARSLQPILLDLPGFGKSSKPSKDFSLDDYARIVEKFLKQQGINKLCVFGHSFGGAIAIKLAVRGDVKIKKLVLCNASGIRRQKAEGKSLQATSYKLQPVIKEVSKLPVIKNIYPILRKFYYYYILRNRDYIDYQEIAGTFKKVVAEDLTPILHKVNVPTLLLWGENDRDTPVEHAKIMQSKIADCRLKIVKGVGHGLPKFKPEVVAREVVDFINS
jgi:pimeloyl-ACP methyl ester carboxylesterase